MSLDPYRNRFTQLLLALFGSVALLLGAAMHSQRTSQAAPQRQNADLAHANNDLDRLGIELRKAAQRNLRMEEEQARRLKAEIHDEPGKNLTAMHARLNLAENLLDAAQRSGVTASIVDILGTMRRSVHGLMDSLRPPTLDEFGLVRALADGPLHDMVERAGIHYDFIFAGEPALVDALREDSQIAIWRIAQEAATNSVRHAPARRFDARLRIGIRGEAEWAIVDYRDDGVGIDATRDRSRRGESLARFSQRLAGAGWRNASIPIGRLHTAACVVTPSIVKHAAYRPAIRDRHE